MKNIIIKSLPYVVGFILLNLICYTTSNFYAQEEKYQSRIELFLSSKNKSIFLGDSHSETIRHLNEDNHIGNLAFGADGIKEMYVKSLIVTDFNPDIQYAFISTEPQLFNNSISSNSSFLNPYLLRVKDSLDIYEKSKLNLFVERVPLFNDNYLKFFLNKTLTDIRNFGKQSKKENWEELPESKKKTIATKTGKIDHNNILSNSNDTVVFREMVKLYKSKNIKVIGVRFPVYPEYIEQCEPNDLKNVNDFIESLDLDFNLDYSYTIKNPMLFADEDHLNEKGVVELARYIHRDTGIQLSK
ncbi:hypothetical protein [Flagellimonas nanhaiensis]|uniref:SGNH/GDSL hydrolase family protein n=1 Tax=Flagellimonas nanhaiensis TaxID=2292706 RepID=A0A371JKV4_9FLAO|nr:hypothetical protein [Allomuricauda nanhaiensis]RDY57597.1 hypothetical protein DX873_18490 [Allomuricauda nanhaiensis]